MFARDAYNVLQSQLESAVATITPLPSVFNGWPTEQALLNQVAKSSNTFISLYDPGFSRDDSRFLLFTANEVTTQAGITSTVSRPLLVDTVTVTLGGTVVTNDAVSVVLGKGQETETATASAGATDTPTTMATKLASAVNASLASWVSASASGAVVTLTNITSSVLRVASNVGNVGSRYTEVGRLVRDVQIDVWAGSDVQRVVVARLVEQQLTYLDANFGVQGLSGTDGTWVRVRRMSDRFIDDDVNRGLYRWCFRATLEYGQTAEESLWAVLSFLPSVTGSVAVA